MHMASDSLAHTYTHTRYLEREGVGIGLIIYSGTHILGTPGGEETQLTFRYVHIQQAQICDNLYTYYYRQLVRLPPSFVLLSFPVYTWTSHICFRDPPPRVSVTPGRILLPIPM